MVSIPRSVGWRGFMPRVASGVPTAEMSRTLRPTLRGQAVYIDWSHHRPLADRVVKSQPLTPWRPTALERSDVTL